MSKVINGGFGSRFPMAITKVACPVCTKEQDGDLLLGKTSTTKPEGEHEIDKLNGQVLGMAECACSECRDKLKVDGSAYVVCIDEEKTDDRNNPWRTGHVFGLSPDFFKRLLDKDPDMYENVMHRGFLYMDIKVAKQIGMPI